MAPTQISHWVLDGGNGIFPERTCVTDPAATRAHDMIIAAQAPPPRPSTPPFTTHPRPPSLLPS